jgi:phosphoglycolate phosphatase-like HAD superfamily hydrolase
MLREIVRAARGARGVMIGDRDNDREAAAANGLPFVLFAGGFSGTTPRDGDRVVRDYAELRRLLLGVDGGAGS